MRYPHIVFSAFLFLSGAVLPVLPFLLTGGTPGWWLAPVELVLFLGAIGSFAHGIAPAVRAHLLTR
ncbi:MAG: hypothetical protein ACI8S6_000995 [Myxococcota bacterium]|jgi:hypothetical protein